MYRKLRCELCEGRLWVAHHSAKSMSITDRVARQLLYSFRAFEKSWPELPEPSGIFLATARWWLLMGPAGCQSLCAHTPLTLFLMGGGGAKGRGGWARRGRRVKTVLIWTMQRSLKIPEDLMKQKLILRNKNVFYLFYKYLFKQPKNWWHLACIRLTEQDCRFYL